MKKTLNKKYGFSLFEAVVVMGIVAIFVAAATNVFTKKHKQVQEKTPHGRFECYYSGDQLVQQLFTENMSQQKQNVSDHCTFKPVKNAPYYVVNLVGGGGAGSSSQYGGGAGEYRSFFVTTIEKELQITPGKAGTSSGDSGEESVAYNITNAGEKEDLATVAGGQYGFNINTLSGNNVSDCSVNNTGYVCNKDPVCIHYGNYIFVGYCKEDERKDENKPDAYTSETVTYDNIKNKVHSKENLFMTLNQNIKLLNTKIKDLCLHLEVISKNFQDLSTSNTIQFDGEKTIQIYNTFNELFKNWSNTLQKIMKLFVLI